MATLVEESYGGSRLWRKNVSEAVEASATCAFGGAVLCDVPAPDTLRSALRYTQKRPHKRDIEETVCQPLSGSNPTTIRSRAYVWELDFRAQLTKRVELEALDAAQGTLCYRDEKYTERVT